MFSNFLKTQHGLFELSGSSISIDLQQDDPIIINEDNFTKIDAYSFKNILEKQNLGASIKIAGMHPKQAIPSQSPNTLIETDIDSYNNCMRDIIQSFTKELCHIKDPLCSLFTNNMINMNGFLFHIFLFTKKNSPITSTIESISGFHADPFKLFSSPGTFISIRESSNYLLQTCTSELSEKNNEYVPYFLTFKGHIFKDHIIKNMFPYSISKNPTILIYILSKLIYRIFYETILSSSTDSSNIFINNLSFMSKKTTDIEIDVYNIKIKLKKPSHEQQESSEHPIITLSVRFVVNFDIDRIIIKTAIPFDDQHFVHSRIASSAHHSSLTPRISATSQDDTMVVEYLKKSTSPVPITKLSLDEIEKNITEIQSKIDDINKELKHQQEKEIQEVEEKRDSELRKINTKIDNLQNQKNNDLRTQNQRLCNYNLHRKGKKEAELKIKLIETEHEKKQSELENEKTKISQKYEADLLTIQKRISPALLRLLETFKKNLTFLNKRKLKLIKKPEYMQDQLKNNESKIIPTKVQSRTSSVTSEPEVHEINDQKSTTSSITQKGSRFHSLSDGNQNTTTQTTKQKESYTTPTKINQNKTPIYLDPFLAEHFFNDQPFATIDPLIPEPSLNNTPNQPFTPLDPFLAEHFFNDTKTP